MQKWRLSPRRSSPSRFFPVLGRLQEHGHARARTLAHTFRSVVVLLLQGAGGWRSPLPPYYFFEERTLSPFLGGSGRPSPTGCAPCWRCEGSSRE